MNSLAQQIAELIVSLGLGILVAFLLQVYQLAFFRLRVARWYAWSWDLIFWLAAVGLVFAALLTINGGEVRAHILLSLFLGGLWFRISFYRRTQKIAQFMARPLAALVGSIYWLIIWPVHLRAYWQKRRIAVDGVGDDDFDDDKTGDMEK